GVRRIEAITGHAARRQLTQESRRLENLAQLLKVPVGEIDTRLTQMLDERKRLERDLADTRKKLAMGGGGKSDDGIRTVGDVKLLARAVDGVDIRDLKGLVD